MAPDQHVANHKRVSLIEAASVVSPSLSRSPIEAQIINVSYGGMGIYVKKPLEGFVEISIILRVGESKEVAETVAGQVMWKRRVGSMYAIGVSFKELNPKDHSRLISYLEQAVKR
jgi:c-di-GMP-binding flagellar brake protein YcgR